MIITAADQLETFIKKNLFILHDEFQRIENPNRIIFHSGNPDKPAVLIEIKDHKGVTTDNPLKRWTATRVVVDEKQYQVPKPAVKKDVKEKPSMEQVSTLD